MRYLLPLLFFLSSCDALNKSSNSLFVSKGPKQSSKLKNKTERECFCNSSGLSETDISSSLLITDIEIINFLEQPLLSFGKVLRDLNEDLIDAGNQAGKYAKQYLDGYINKNLPNGSDIRPRQTSFNKISNEWGKNTDGSFNSSSPYKLFAITFRPDLFRVNAGGDVIDAGEMRLTYKFVPENQSLSTVQDKNFVIVEYRLPVGVKGTGVSRTFDPWDRKMWYKAIAELSCMQEELKISRLLEIVERVVRAKYSGGEWVNGSAFTNLRVNDFLESPWALFQYQLTTEGNLVRSPFKQTPKDNLSTENNGIVKSGISKADNSELVAYLRENFEVIGSLNEETYELPIQLQAWQNNYSIGASWIQDLIAFGDLSLGNDEKGHRSTLLRRNFSLNTCNSCHMNQFRDQHTLFPILFETAKHFDVPNFKYSSLSMPIPFVHLDFRTEEIMSEFLRHDLELRKQELDFFLSIKCCGGIEEYTDLYVDIVDYDKYFNYNGSVNYRVNIGNLGPIDSKEFSLKFFCPDGSALESLKTDVEETVVENEKIFFSNLAVGEKVSVELTCKVNNEVDQLIFSISSFHFQLSIADFRIENNNKSVLSKLQTSNSDDGPGAGNDNSSNSDLNLEVRTLRDKLHPGEDIEYLISLENHGPGKVQIASFVYSCPASSTLVEAKPSAGSTVNSKLWSMRLEKSEKKTLSLTCKPLSSEIGKQFNLISGKLFSTSKDPNETNNRFSHSIGITKKEEEEKQPPTQLLCDYDYNNDGKISGIDLAHMKKVILGAEKILENKYYNLDGKPNDQNIPTTLDLVLLQRFVLGQSSSYEETFSNSKCTKIIPAKGVN